MGRYLDLVDAVLRELQDEQICEVGSPAWERRERRRAARHRALQSNVEQIAKSEYETWYQGKKAEYEAKRLAEDVL